MINIILYLIFLKHNIVLTKTFLEKKIFPYPNINETALSFSFLGMTLDIQWYGLSYIFGVLIAWYLMLLLVRNESLWKENQNTVSKRNIDDLITYRILVSEILIYNDTYVTK